MKILGLDLSCSTCGIAITENKIILYSGFVDISGAETYKDKANLIISALDNKPFERIIIEESLFGFARGGTSQQVIIKLIKNKAVISYILENHNGIKTNIKYYKYSNIIKEIIQINEWKMYMMH